MEFSRQNTGVSSLSFLQGIFPTQGSNPGLPHCRQILYQLSHSGSPKILEWVAYPSPVNLPNPGIERGSPELQVDSLPTELSGKLIANLKCCGSFRWTSKGISHTCTCILSPPSPSLIQAGALHWEEFPVLYRSSLLVTPLKYNTVYVSFPTSLTIPHVWT